MRHRAEHEFEALARRATSCRECFVLGEAEPSTIDVAQPLWVGPRYWANARRLVVLMCNPGQGSDHLEWALERRRRLCQFRDGALALQDIMGELRGAMGWSTFYVHGLGLDLDRIAFANVAWCATKHNVYPTSVLNRCFSRHTSALLDTLRPRVVLAAGGKAQRFAAKLEVSSEPAVIPILHHAHRKGLAAGYKELRRVRAKLHMLEQPTAG